MKRRSSSMLLPLVAGAVLAAGAAMADQEVYRWVDQDGVVHFSDRPTVPDAVPTGVFVRPTDPQQVSKQLMREQYQANQAEAASAEQTENDAERATRQAEEARTRDLQCNAARERFQVYTTAPRLYESLPDGGRRYLTDDELTAAREQAKADIEKWCN